MAINGNAVSPPRGLYGMKIAEERVEAVRDPSTGREGRKDGQERWQEVDKEGGSEREG